MSSRLEYLIERHSISISLLDSLAYSEVELGNMVTSEWVMRSKWGYTGLREDEVDDLRTNLSKNSWGGMVNFKVDIQIFKKSWLLLREGCEGSLNLVKLDMSQNSERMDKLDKAKRSSLLIQVCEMILFVSQGSRRFTLLYLFWFHHAVCFVVSAVYWLIKLHALQLISLY